jgi:hypothetical protein
LHRLVPGAWEDFAVFYRCNTRRDLKRALVGMYWMCALAAALYRLQHTYAADAAPTAVAAPLAMPVARQLPTSIPQPASVRALGKTAVRLP